MSVSPFYNHHPSMDDLQANADSSDMMSTSSGSSFTSTASNVLDLLRAEDPVSFSDAQRVRKSPAASDPSISDAEAAACDYAADPTGLPLDNDVLFPLALTVQANLMACQDLGEDARSAQVDSVKDIEAYLRCLMQVTECPESYVVTSFLYQLRYQVHMKRSFCGSDWRTACLIGLIVAQKALDDFVVPNGEFAPLLGDDTAERINKLEHELLIGMKWKMFMSRKVFNAYVVQLKKLGKLSARRRVQ